MGTNFYIGTNSKDVRDKYFGYDYNLTDAPTWLYYQHIAKTSYGWLPLFQAHDSIKSVKQLKELYDTGEFIIFDEYDITYTWPEFKERVLEFNGGISGVQEKEEIVNVPGRTFYDKNLPKYKPISHCPGTDCSYKFDYYANEYYKDPEGYEFTTHDFC